MLKIEIIKFEAQDVITSSVACACNDDCKAYVDDKGTYTLDHANCGCTSNYHYVDIIEKS